MSRLFLATTCLAAVLASALALGANAAPASSADLAGPISDYKIWVAAEVDAMQSGAKAFTDAVRAGDLAKAKALYAPARMPYERIEPIAELFSDLDKSMDVRADDFARKEADPAFTGFHRLEYALFAKNSTEGMAPVADKLDADIVELKSRINGLTVPPNKVVGGAAALIEEVAKTKISGEEDRYSRTDLWDFAANVEGAKKIHELLHPLTTKANPKLVQRIDANFAKVEAVLAKYAVPTGGYESYEKLSKKDRTGVRGPVTALAEDLSKLRGTLGLD
ncbi:EfeM/EfeO family lipoprotein [Rhodoblastus sphagnicola]|uniref:EfeM/EfeO family lipoprotein n=1 Tax=Rhodoblastus sphagnicola TaxID=333368 RepID=A0A2S6MX92_9HYPH|nr:iron uptake system protein EfeO [Rhodoblastus sphagnicola]MBB4199313.1 iron uptake system component EfeO [Rhodoblastus sphagnicola]PPQ26977.1 EfeM/EfeO family lipoprotein [Rhodoblastus sphagnicola]